eukprot:CAMPEP_0202866374 /NCGR_PEP_ID=MMETSP1391-20130828/7355_1 /ASSEMBLY_ACC=CAM_ASM_000867 /TAXON_ID=1034604 /ORGANISM="Chlamydomonas leiostraca, Strain SAG 11-49" /LENGTH=87 /DNA_ID=CAMNT_0049546311 /DNA_START=36 /DNA_END=299 /DNA_ORIENTATION=+
MVTDNHGSIPPRENPLLYWLRESLGATSKRNIAAWGMAGAIAYWLWVVPQQEEEAKRKAIVEEWQNKYKTSPGQYSPAGFKDPAKQQ